MSLFINHLVSRNSFKRNMFKVTKITYNAVLLRQKHKDKILLIFSTSLNSEDIIYIFSCTIIHIISIVFVSLTRYYCIMQLVIIICHVITDNLSQFCHISRFLSWDFCFIVSLCQCTLSN
jgi:hypothetical protein